MKILVGFFLALSAITASAESSPSLLTNIKPYDYKRELAKHPDAKLGMSQDEVLNKTNYGVPIDILTTVTAKETLEQWVYEGRRYLYFNNGKLSKIQ